VENEDLAIRAVAALDEPSRRGMYAFIRTARRPVTRDEAAVAVGISRKLAAFHLDKLVEAGVLRVSAARSGRVGRAPKVYEPSDVDIRVSVPERQHDVLAGILVDAVLSERSDERASDAAVRVAKAYGESVGGEERARTRPGRLGVERALTLAAGVLARHGFEPSRVLPSCLRLRNCPFHPLAAKAPELVCAINHAFLSGILNGLNAKAVRAILEPRAGECCVELGPSFPCGEAM
jgi:predicted ArsR family transcriptional regulator